MELFRALCNASHPWPFTWLVWHLWAGTCYCFNVMGSTNCKTLAIFFSKFVNFRVCFLKSPPTAFLPNPSKPRLAWEPFSFPISGDSRAGKNRSVCAILCFFYQRHFIVGHFVQFCLVHLTSCSTAKGTFDFDMFKAHSDKHLCQHLIRLL